MRASDSVKSIMINDELMIISAREELDFYYIATKDLKSFIKMKEYSFKYSQKGLSYSYHGMSCIDFKHTIDKENKINQFNVKILLIGGMSNNAFFESLLIVEVMISLPFYQLKPVELKMISKFRDWTGGVCDKFDTSKLDYNNCNIKIIKETKIDARKLWNNYTQHNCDNNNNNNNKLVYDEYNEYRWSLFGTQCLSKTYNDDKIVLLFGGYGIFVNKNQKYGISSDDYKNGKSLFILNIGKCQLTKIQNVCNET